MNNKFHPKNIGMSFGLVLALIVAPVLAGTPDTLDEDVVLTVSGLKDSPYEGNAVALDRAMLEEMPQVTFKTSTIWTEGEIEFTGVLLSDILRHLTIESGTLRATAINDYAVEIPVAEALKEPAIVAFLMNGEPMSIREKGPLWIVYPYDADKKFQSEVYYSRSIWQLDRIIVE